MHTSRRCLSLLTDYGAGSEFVGMCRAVATEIAPQIPFIDLCHTITPHAIREGAFVLERSLEYLPEGVHVAVVDPGVGTARAAIAVDTGERVFVGPDNGVLWWALEALGEIRQAVRIDREDLWQKRRGPTFDGRDIFVPVAAHLATGLDLQDVGTPVEVGTLARLEAPAFLLRAQGVAMLEILRVDSFGNLTTSASRARVTSLALTDGQSVEVTINGRRARCEFGRRFADVEPGHLLAYLDSFDHLAVAIRQGSARDYFDARPGGEVLLELARP